jgi:two-component system NtrC family sensor kinase
MNRRDVITLLGGAAAAWPLAARAQQPARRVRSLLLRILSLQAEAAAGTIGQFVKEMESQIGWTTQLPWSVGTMDQRRFDALRLLRLVPAVTGIAMLDDTGKEQLRVSRLRFDVVGGNTDFSHDPKFTEAVARKVYYGPVYLSHGNDIYMTLSLAGTRRDSGVSVVEVALKLVWDVIQQLKVGEHGVAYVLDAQDRIIGHSAMFNPEVFQRDFSGLAQVQAARAAGSGAGVVQAHDINGREVLAASAPVAAYPGLGAIPGLGWLVIVELPVEEADAPAQ